VRTLIVPLGDEGLKVTPFFTVLEIKSLPSLHSTNAYKTFKLQETRLSTIEQHSRIKFTTATDLFPKQ